MGRAAGLCVVLALLALAPAAVRAPTPSRVPQSLTLRLQGRSFDWRARLWGWIAARDSGEVAACSGSTAGAARRG